MVLEDIDENIRTLNPEASPLYTLGQIFGRGSKPKSHKIQVIQYDSFDNMDFSDDCVLGSATNAVFKRFARIKLTQPSRPTTSGSMYYSPQDKFYIVATGQTVICVMTPTAAIRETESSYSTLPTAFTGGASTSVCVAGYVVVQNIHPEAMKDFSTSDVVYLGRTIFESQDIEADPAQRDVLFDCNLVEHKEKVISMTEDQRYLVTTKGKVPDWTFQQRAAFKELKKDVDYTAFFSTREIEFKIPGLPMRHMNGLVNAIKTNVAVYNPATITDFEEMFSNFLFDMAFRYNPNGQKKIGICGGRFLHNFNKAFKDYRRTTDLEVKAKKVGMDIQGYFLPGGFNVGLTRSEVLRQNTALENWCFIIDPPEAEWRIMKDFKSRMYQEAKSRKDKLMIEWQGTIAWHREQTHALLKTI